MADFSFTKLRPRIRSFSQRKGIFFIIPVSWIWLQLLAVVAFLTAAVWAGFAFSGGELDKRAKQAVADYFKNTVGGMTEEQMKKKIADIESADQMLNGPGLLSQFRSLEDRALDTPWTDFAPSTSWDDIGAVTHGRWCRIGNCIELVAWIDFHAPMSPTAPDRRLFIALPPIPNGFVPTTGDHYNYSQEYVGSGMLIPMHGQPVLCQVMLQDDAYDPPPDSKRRSGWEMLVEHELPSPGPQRGWIGSVDPKDFNGEAFPQFKNAGDGYMEIHGTIRIQPAKQ